jgi:CheY-like chemotaxis protein
VIASPLSLFKQNARINQLSNKTLAEKPAITARALIVDDELPLRDLLTAMLRRLGITTIVSPDARHALEYLQGDNDFQVLFVDMQLPIMNGAEFVGHAKALYPTIPIVVMTAHNRRDLINMALRLGAEAEMDYPYVRDNVIKALEDVGLR